jgi:predicted PurR-regulated permease PerM
MPLGLDGRTLRVVWTVAVAAAVAALVYLLRHLLVMLTDAVFFAYLLHPVVAWLERRLPTRRRRVLALLATYAALVVGVTALGMAVGPRLSAEVTALVQRLPAMTASIQSGALTRDVLSRVGVPATAVAGIQDAIRTHTGEWLGTAQRLVTAFVAWAAGAWEIVLVPIFAFIMLANADLVTAAGSFFADRRHRRLWRTIACDVHDALAEYVRALILLSLATFVVWTLVLSLAGVPYALVLAAVAAVLEFVPLVGPLIGGAIAVVVCIVTGYAHPWLVAGFAIGWRLVQDYVTSPLVMGRGIEMPPGLVIFAILGGGELAGPVGMFLAVPVVAAARIIWRDSRAAALTEEQPPPAVRRVS